MSKSNKALTGIILIIACPIAIASGFSLVAGLAGALISGGVVVGIIGGCLLGAD